ncbi:MAG: ankyrin repeat domain-containing protein [Coxiellaceae bacterium]|nr:MAG: ankyrin repeat domain-containing protein [Coxiellaceae bacterium]
MKKKISHCFSRSQWPFSSCSRASKNPRSHKALNVKAVVEARDNNHDDIVAYLLSQFDINTIDDDGETLLHYAIQEGDLSWVALLIELGADINLQNRAGETPLEKAAFYAINMNPVMSACVGYLSHVNILQLLSFLLQKVQMQNLTKIIRRCSLWYKQAMLS